MSCLHCTWQRDSDCSSSICEISTEIPRTHKLAISPLSPSTGIVRGTQVSGSPQRTSSWPFAHQPQRHLPPALEARLGAGVFISILSPPSFIPRSVFWRRPPFSAASSALLKAPALPARRPCCQNMLPRGSQASPTSLLLETPLTNPALLSPPTPASSLQPRLCLACFHRTSLPLQLWPRDLLTYTCKCRGHVFSPWSRKIPHASEQLSPVPQLLTPRSRAHRPEQEKPQQGEARAPQQRVAPADHD